MRKPKMLFAMIFIPMLLGMNFTSLNLAQAGGMYEVPLCSRTDEPGTGVGTASIRKAKNDDNYAENR